MQYHPLRTDILQPQQQRTMLGQRRLMLARTTAYREYLVEYFANAFRSWICANESHKQFQHVIISIMTRGNGDKSKQMLFIYAMESEKS